MSNSPAQPTSNLSRRRAALAGGPVVLWLFTALGAAAQTATATPSGPILTLGGGSIQPTTSGIPANGTGQIDVLTYHNDLARTGQDLNEVLLTPSNINPVYFGKQFTANVDGQVYAQPLYKSGVYIAGQGWHNVVFVCTEHDSVYAFDAESGAQLWQTSFISPPNTVTMSQADAFGCTQITPEIGITGTPVIDPTTNRLYVVATTKENAASSSPIFAHTLHALDIGSGLDTIFTGSGNSVPGVEITATYPGSAGDGNNPTLTFAPQYYKERAGLLLLNGVVYTSWASHCDIRTYHGWIMGYDEATFQQVSVYNNTPNSPTGGEDTYGASFWGAGAAPAVDSSGNIFVVGGNGTFSPLDSNYGNCFLRLTPSGSTLATADYFAPYNIDYLNDNDLDLGSSGTLLLPDSVGTAAHPHLMVSAGKEGRLYLLDRDNLGQMSGNDANALQAQTGVINAMYSTPAYFNNLVYTASVGQPLTALNFSYDGAGGARLVIAAQAPDAYGYPGAVPSISANGSANGLAWTIDPSGVLRASDASNLPSEVYNSGPESSGRDALGSVVKFSVPTITNGRVYVGTNNTVLGFGLFTTPTATDVTLTAGVVRGALVYQRPSGQYTQLVTVTNAGTAAINGPISLCLDSLSGTASLATALGTTSYTVPTGSYYQNADNNPASVAPGQSVTFHLIFSDPSLAPITYTVRVLAGIGSR